MIEYVIAALCAATLLISIFALIRASKRNECDNSADFAEIKAMLNRLTAYSDYSAKTSADLNGMLVSSQRDRLNELNKTLDGLSKTTEARLFSIQKSLSDELKYIAGENAKNLELIRITVDEKLSSTLENRLAKSYSMISERIETVYKELGELQKLSESVTNMNKVFANVKLRGSWGEAQLSTLLEQMLSPEQYASSVKLNRDDNTMVDFAVVMPSKDEEKIYLPIDSKFPLDAYERLCYASEGFDKTAVINAQKELARAVKAQSDSIAKKYVVPPKTTDFAIMYLPVEALYAEVLKLNGVVDYLYKQRVMVCGPSTFGAMLSVLQTAFKTSAIEKRSGELWQLLSLVRQEFSNFTQLLEKTRKKLLEAQDGIETATRRTKKLERKLSSIEGGNAGDETLTELLGGEDGEGETDE